jgi:triphosphoribosyl-dephospho-CoA synthetase
MTRSLALACIGLALGVPSSARGGALADSGPRALGELRRYNAEEAKLGAQDTVTTAGLITHWKRLDTIAGALERLDRTGDAKRLDPAHWVAVRHELSQLFEAPAEIVELRGDPVTERTRTADLRRRQNLLRIALVANRCFDLGIHEVLGIKVEAGTT